MFSIEAVVAVSPVVIGIIIGSIQVVKGWLKKTIEKAGDEKKQFFDRLWIALVGILAIAAGCLVTAGAGWPWWAAIASSFAYFFSAQGAYSSVKAAAPKKEE